MRWQTQSQPSSTTTLSLTTHHKSTLHQKLHYKITHTFNTTGNHFTFTDNNFSPTIQPANFNMKNHHSHTVFQQTTKIYHNKPIHNRTLPSTFAQPTPSHSINTHSDMSSLDNKCTTQNSTLWLFKKQEPNRQPDLTLNNTPFSHHQHSKDTVVLNSGSTQHYH